MERKRTRKLRQTRSSNITRKGRSNGRPTGTYKKFPFYETKVGFLIKWEAPILYQMLMKSNSTYYYAPDIDVMIYLVSRLHPELFQSPKFQNALKLFRKQGLCCHKPTKATPAYMEKIKRKRDKKLKQYIKTNFKKINALRLANVNNN